MYQEWFEEYEELLRNSKEDNNYEIKLIIKNCISEPFFRQKSR